MEPTRNILLKIGFKEIPRTSLHSAQEEPDLSFDFGNFFLHAYAGINRYLAEVLYFSGMNKNERVIQEIDFELPQEVESFEQAIALLSFQLGKKLDATHIPEWYFKGQLLEEHLPWKKEQLEYKKRPLAKVDYDYYRLLIRKMIDLAVSASIDEITTISFDGEILNIKCAGVKLVAPASGMPWEETISIKTKHLYYLPKRIKKEPGIISIWKNNLYFDNLAFRLNQHLTENA